MRFHMCFFLVSLNYLCWVNPNSSVSKHSVLGIAFLPIFRGQFGIPLVWETHFVAHGSWKRDGLAMMGVFVKGVDTVNTVTALLITVGVCSCKGEWLFCSPGESNPVPVPGLLMYAQGASQMPVPFIFRVHSILVFPGEGWRGSVMRRSAGSRGIHATVGVPLRRDCVLPHFTQNSKVTEETYRVPV